MRSRRPHHKTRHGCIRCKERRIKCCETKPVCLNCQRYQSVCTYKPTTTRNTGISVSKLGATDAALSNLIVKPYNTPPSTEASSSTPPVTKNLQRKDQDTYDVANVQDLQLLHHYTTVSCFTTIDDVALQPIFQTLIPQKAFSHPFLLHGILAFSALHQAQLQPEDESFLRLAFHHHRISITAHRNDLENLCKANWEVLFVSASFISIFIAAIGRFPRLRLGTMATATPLDHVVDFANFLQGILAVLENSQQWVEGSEMKPLLRRHIMHKPLPEPRIPLKSLLELDERNRASDASEDMIKLFEDCIQRLQQSFYRANNVDPDTSVVVMHWLVQSPDTYIAAVKSRTPMALAILAHHCVLLQKKCHAWWSEDWGKRLLAHISEVLDENWQLSIRWAVDEIRILEKANCRETPLLNRQS